MCLILFAINQHPQYDLIVAANRDEFYERPTADAAFWHDHKHVLAGRDLEAGGTWLGVNSHGRVAMLTNYRDFSTIKENAPSRRHLVADYLINNDHQGFQQVVTAKSALYSGYNLVFGTSDELVYFSNITERLQPLKKGIFGLSNHLLNTPWPKVEKGKESLAELIKQDHIEPESLFAALYDDIKAPDHMLPETGVGLEKEKMLSPIFIKSADYGSRCSTIVLADKSGQWIFYERVYNVTDFSYRTNRYEFKEERFK